VSFGGVVSAEHGIGKLKRMFLELMYTPDEIGQMRRVKQALDPGNLLNPGVIFCD
jgi:FAD/FMN-containing dehydrogenase